MSEPSQLTRWRGWAQEEAAPGIPENVFADAISMWTGDPSEGGVERCPAPGGEGSDGGH